MQYSNIHTHTTFSDGKNTPEEMILGAIDLGFSSIGISDHSEVWFQSQYCLLESEYEEYQILLSELKKKYEDKIDVLCGIELDNDSKKDLSGFDYTIASVHYIFVGDEWFPVDQKKEYLFDFISKHGRGDHYELARRYFDLVATMSQKGGFDVLGHFDLINKFSLFDDEDEIYQKIALEALDEVIKTAPRIEVNTGAISRGYKTLPYPASPFLSRIAQKGGKLVLNGDSHRVETLDTYFPESIELLKKTGFSSIECLGKNGWKEINL